MDREERLCHRMELYRLRRERETTEEREDKATSCDTSILFSCTILLLCTWPLLQFYSVRTRHEMDDILDVKKCLQKCAEFNPYVINFLP